VDLHSGLVVENDTGPDESDTGQDALDDPAHRILIEFKSPEAGARQENERGTERHEPERSHSDGLVVKIPVEPDRHARESRHEEAENRLQEVTVDPAGERHA
jgi:hypothetical protein